MQEIVITTSKRMEPQNGSLPSIKVLKDLTEALSSALAAMDTFRPPDIRRGVSFYDEVRRFEIDLIRHALTITYGSQARAAKLLDLNATTLNSKIKAYNIEWKKSHEERPAVKQGEG